MTTFLFLSVGFALGWLFRNTLGERDPGMALEIERLKQRLAQIEVSMLNRMGGLE